MENHNKFQTTSNPLIQTNQLNTSNLKELGNNCVKEQNYLQAITYYSEAIKLEPDNPAFHSNIALCQFELGNYELSSIACKKAINFTKKTDNITLGGGKPA